MTQIPIFFHFSQIIQSTQVREKKLLKLEKIVKCQSTSKYFLLTAPHGNESLPDGIFVNFSFPQGTTAQVHISELLF